MKRITIFPIIIFLVVISFSYAWAQTTKDEAYKVGINDVLDIQVVDHKDMSTLANVTGDGTIVLPYIGTIYVKGKGLSDIKEEVTKKLSEGYVKYPVVSVSLVKSLSKMVYLYGEVRRPGMFPMEGKMTTLTALTIAGGVSESGLYGLIKLKRIMKGTTSYKEIELGSIKDIENSKKGDMLLEPDDIIIVGRNKTFFIQGEVLKRGRYPLDKDVTVLRALIEAGGATENGLFGSIKVRRVKQGATGDYVDIADANLENGVINKSDVENIILQPDDILIVERNKTYLIKGEVVKRGRFILENDVTVLSALIEAGGVSDNGLFGKVKLLRKQNGTHLGYEEIIEAGLNNGVIDDIEVRKITLQPDDILEVERNKTFYIHGEVGRTGEFVLGKDMTVVKAISSAGNISSDGRYGSVKIRRKQEAPPGYKDIHIDFKGTVEESGLGDISIEPDDILIVDRNATFLIYGEVARPGEYVLQDNMTAFKAITIAGGLSKWGSEGRVKILRHKPDFSGFETIKVNINDIIKGDVAADVNLQSQDTIVVSSGIF